MKLVVIKSKDPFLNLAAEEYFLKNTADEYFLLWQNDHTIVIGNNQNLYNEINVNYVKQNQINIVRRLSGGGAVYQDLGGLNFTFIIKKNHDQQAVFSYFCKPLISLLQDLNLNAKILGKNDVAIDGKKICGNAQFIDNNKIMHHGCILFNVNLNVLANSLKPNILKLKSKGIKSNRVHVTNIFPLLAKKINIDEFINLFVKKIKTLFPNIAIDQISSHQEKIFKQRAQTFFKSQEFIYGKNPMYSFVNEKYFNHAGVIKINAEIVHGKFSKFAITGDFLAKRDITPIERKFLGINHCENDITNVVENISNFEDYFPNCHKKDFISLIFGVKYLN